MDNGLADHISYNNDQTRNEVYRNYAVFIDNPEDTNDEYSIEFYDNKLYDYVLFSITTNGSYARRFLVNSEKIREHDLEAMINYCIRNNRLDMYQIIVEKRPESIFYYLYDNRVVKDRYILLPVPFMKINANAGAMDLGDVYYNSPIEKRGFTLEYLTKRACSIDVLVNIDLDSWKFLFENNPKFTWELAHLLFSADSIWLPSCLPRRREIFRFLLKFYGFNIFGPIRETLIEAYIYEEEHREEFFVSRRTVSELIVEYNMLMDQLRIARERRLAPLTDDERTDAEIDVQDRYQRLVTSLEPRNLEQYGNEQYEN